MLTAPTAAQRWMEVMTMVAARLTTDTVRRILMDMLRDMPYLARDGMEAVQNMSYIGGAVDMANAVIEAIKDLGGN